MSKTPSKEIPPMFTTEDIIKSIPTFMEVFDLMQNTIKELKQQTSELTLENSMLRDRLKNLN